MTPTIVEAGGTGSGGGTGGGPNKRTPGKAGGGEPKTIMTSSDLDDDKAETASLVSKGSKGSYDQPDYGSPKSAQVGVVGVNPALAVTTVGPDTKQPSAQPIPPGSSAETKKHLQVTEFKKPIQQHQKANESLGGLKQPSPSTAPKTGPEATTTGKPATPLTMTHKTILSTNDPSNPLAAGPNLHKFDHAPVSAPSATPTGHKASHIPRGIAGHPSAACFIPLLTSPPNIKTERTFTDGQVVGTLTLVELARGQLLTLQVTISSAAKHLGVLATYKALKEVGLVPPPDKPPGQPCSIGDMAAHTGQSLLLRLIIFDRALADQFKAQAYPFPMVPSEQTIHLDLLTWSAGSGGQGLGLAQVPQPALHLPLSQPIVPTPPWMYAYPRTFQPPPPGQPPLPPLGSSFMVPARSSTATTPQYTNLNAPGGSKSPSSGDGKSG